ncbi:MAG TPA: exopolyphosphatase [Vicinamibacteria bacterium]|nr:exopolyphosphatase [Vicinamibacteria bacterium]
MKSDTYGAVDLGSNSFHMFVVRVVNDELHILDRMRDRVRLAAGLDSNSHLTEEAQARALSSLERFGERLRDIPPQLVRAVGTNTLRRAHDTTAFLRRSSEALGHQIEIISGLEEARLIYLGVSHSLPDSPERRLVVDIGGGSTECVVGERFEPIEAASLYMGCVGYSIRFFPEGQVSEENLARAETAARVELETIERKLKTLGWHKSFGSSGTIIAIEEILRASDWSSQGITRKGLRKLRKALLRADNMKDLSLPGLKSDRAPVLPGGLAILNAVFESLEIEEMKSTTGALREGILYDLLGRIRHEDVRDRTIQRLVDQYHVDREQAARVERTGLDCLAQVADRWELSNPETHQLFVWATRLHEVGRAVSYSGYHKHGAYLIAHSDLPGFSTDDQLLLAALVASHRRKLSLDPFKELRAVSPDQALRLCLLLRLAVLVNRGRSPRPLPLFKLEADKNKLMLTFPEDWLEEHPLARADLEEETGLLKKVDFQLVVS